MLLNVEVVGVDILNNVGEVGFWHSLNFYLAMRLQTRLSKLVLGGEHRLEIGGSHHQNSAVCLDKSVSNREDNVIELIQVLALIH